MNLGIVEQWVRWVGGATVLVPLIAVLWGLWEGLHRPYGRTTGWAHRVLRAPFYLVVSILYFGLCLLIWKPLPLSLSQPARIIALALGALLYFPGLALLLWARLTLGEMYNVSSGFGVQLYADQRLITHGPFALVRHPMYLGLMMAAFGGVLMYRTWTLAFLAVNSLFVAIRAWREEQALAIRLPLRAELGGDERVRHPALHPVTARDRMRATHHPVPAWREQVGSLLRDRKPVVVAEMLVVVLIPALWELLPLPRTIIPLLLLAWLSLWLRQRGWGNVGLRHPESWLLTCSTGIAIAAAAAILGYTVVNPMLLRLTGEAATANGLAFLRGNLLAFLALLAFTWPLAAVAEEMVYRGYVLNRLADLFGQSRLGWGISLMLSAVMFSLAHGQYGPRFIVTSSLMGLVEGGSYLLSRRNLWLPIVVHGMSNTISLALLFLGL